MFLYSFPIRVISYYTSNIFFAVLPFFFFSHMKNILKVSLTLENNFMTYKYPRRKEN